MSLLRCNMFVLILALSSGAPIGANPPLLERDVLPILTKNCMGCHGGLVKEGGLDLRTLPSMLAGGDSGKVIESGKASQSELWKLIASDDMPAGKDREKLSAEAKATIRAWIDAGVPTVAQHRKHVDPLLSPGKKHSPGEVAKSIDRHIDDFLASAKMEAVPRCDDAEFLRRIYLDLTGRVPTAEEASAFLDDKKADKRAKLVDRLLETPQFGEQFGRSWRDWVCPPELPSDNNGGAQPFDQARRFGDWLGKKFVAGEPWDTIARDILTVKGGIKTNPQVIFYGLVGHGGKTTADGSARAVASLFMGVQLQCARCHDDPYRDWSQREHWALAGFFGRSQGDFNKIEVGKGPSKKPGEIAIPGDAFKNAGTVVPVGFLRSSVKPGKLEGDVRESLADWLTAKENPYFARAFANRLWFYLFSRGIVDPVDDIRELNPPSHPGLLLLLANEFRDSEYDIKHLIRCVCNSATYQRTSRFDPKADKPSRDALNLAFGRMPLRVMTADMLHDSLKLAFGEREMDLRSGGKVSTTGQAAPVGNAYLEFHRHFDTNEEDSTDFTHGIAQMLTMINHPRLLGGSKALDEYRKKHKPASKEVVEWLYLSTLSRRPTDEELSEALKYVGEASDPKVYNGVLWMLVNRSEYILRR